jgi:hypothetical protein
MDRIICECCNKKIRPIKNNEARISQWKKKPFLDKLCKGCNQFTKNECYGCTKRYLEMMNTKIILYK